MLPFLSTSSAASRSAFLLAWLSLACGRTGLDDLVDVTGTAGASVRSDDAGGTGGVGTGGISGAAGFTTGTCIEGDTGCATNESSQTCVNGAWMTSPINCKYVCVGSGCVTNTKTVFVTSQTFQGGKLGGLTGADAICQRLAKAAGLTGTFLAWLSDSTGSPATRFTKDGGPYQLTDGTEIARNWIDLTNTGVESGISLTERRTAPPHATTPFCGPLAVWTDTGFHGTLEEPDRSCDDWSNIDGTGGALGVASSVFNWTFQCDETAPSTREPCAATAPLYCFEQ
jgi:hypothetical protein